jgi:fucose permease
MIILTAILSMFVYGVVASLLGTIMPAFHLGMAQNGSIALAQAMGLILASLSTGPFIDATGKKAALVTGLSLLCICLYFLPQTAGDYQKILICLFIVGFAEGVTAIATNALAAAVDQTRRASMLNFLNLFFGVGGLVTPFLAANVLHGDTTTLCYVAAVLAAVALAVGIVTPMPLQTSSFGFKITEAARMLNRPALWLIALLIFLYVACEVSVWNWLATYLISRGIDRGTALNILSLGFALGLLLGRLAASRVLIRIAPSTVILVSAVCMVVTTYAMLQTSNPTLAWIAVFTAGLAMAPVFPTSLAIIGDNFPVMTATAMGLVITFGWIGLAVSSPLIGAISGAASGNLGTALLLLPAFSILMVLVNLALRPLLRSAESHPVSSRAV